MSALVRGIGVLLIAAFPALASAQTDEPNLRPKRLPRFARVIPPELHWAQELEEGHRRVRNGVVEVRLPFAGSQPALTVAGVEEQPPTGLFKLGVLSPDDRKAQAAWIAESHVGKDLPPSTRRELKELYQDYAQRPAPKMPDEITAQLSRLSERREAVPPELQEEIDAWVEEMRDQAAAELATLLVQERRLLREDVPAQFRRYGKPLKEGLTIDADALERELREFTRRPYREAPPSPPARPPGPMRRLPRASPLEPLRHSLSLPAEGCAEPGTTERRVVAVGAPETIGYEGRVYVAESIAFNSDLLFEAGVPHTSIVAGIWEILSWNLAKETRTCTADLSWVIHEQSPLPPQMQHVFLDWVLANGCAGEYPDDANLLLVLKAADFGDHSYETTLRYLRGTSNDTAGEVCRARFGAVPKGYYGVHYVCHQACNAFASVKWGIIPVNEWYSELVFGETGKLGVSDTEHPCYCPVSLPLWVATGLSASGGYNGGDCEACAVDKDCCWVDAWGGGSGHAYGVEYGWDHIQGQWVDAGFRFDSEEPPLDGHQFDDPPPSFNWAHYP